VGFYHSSYCPPERGLIQYHTPVASLHDVQGHETINTIDYHSAVAKTIKMLETKLV
jgi:hypothetical protein